MKPQLALLLAGGLLVSCGIAPRKTARLSQPLPSGLDSKGEPVEAEREDSADEAAEFYLLKRTGGDPLPMERLLAARDHARQMPLYSLANRRFVSRSGRDARASLGLGTWQPLGPGNIGGRTRSLVIRPDDPNTMYAGSVGGGVWKTTDGGQSWNPLSDLLPSIGIGSLAIDPSAPDTLYAGTGEYYTNSQRGDQIRGLGIFKTTDGGATWAQLFGTNNSSFYYVNKIVVSPKDSNHVYAATWAGIWASRNGGDTWSLVLDRRGPHYGCQDLVIRTDQASDYLYASCAISAESTPAIYRNVDAAGSGKWEVVFTTANMGRTALALAPSNQSEIYAISASSESGKYSRGLLGVYRSMSNGDPGTWETRVTNQDSNRLNTLILTNPREAFADVCSNGTATYGNQGEYDLAIAVDPLNPDVVWAGGIDIFRSDDGGANWGIAAFWQAAAPQLSHADNHGFVFPPNYNGGDVQSMYAISDGGVYRTDNALAPTATGDRAACTPYSTQVAWTSLNNGYAVTQFYHGAVYPGGGAFMGGTQDNGTLRGSDASGQNAWRAVRGGDGGNVAIDPLDPNIWYSETTNLSLARTADGGATLFTATSGITETATNFLFITPVAMDPSNSRRLYMGGLTLWRTTNGAQSWTAVSTASPSSAGGVSAIAISPTDPDHVVFGTANGFVFRNSSALSADRNTAWDFTLPRTGYLSNLAFDSHDPNIVYATYSQFKTLSSQSHVYRSTDGGATWTGIDGSGDTGLPDVPVFSIIADPQNGLNLYLGTDIGVFVSLDAGATWARDDSPFADTVTETVRLDRTAGQTTLFAFTHGRGVWKVALPGSGDACQYSLSDSDVSLPFTGGTMQVQVTTGDGCAWSVIRQDGSATVASPAGGVGSGTFRISSSRNATTQPQVTHVLIQGKMVTLTVASPQTSGQ